MNKYQIIESPDELATFAENHKQAEWICFDTEFVGEKRFDTTLCLIQVASAYGLFLIDPFRVPDITPFLELVSDPQIKKITHAGENDYRLLYSSYGVLPVNTFDTQIAAGFLGSKYPISFKKLAEKELNKNIDKGYTITNWEQRPFLPKQLKYALDDVIPLRELYEILTRKLIEHDRLSWAEEEFQIQEKDSYYFQDPNKEALNSNLMRSLNNQERLFLLRLIMWRRNKAKEKNYSKEMVLPSKYLSHIARAISSGKDALNLNRRIPSKLVEQYWEDFQFMYNQKMNAEEKTVLQQIALQKNDESEPDLPLDFLYFIAKQLAFEKNIAIDLALPKAWLKEIPNDHQSVANWLDSTWRGQFLGSHFVQWVANYPDLEIHIEGNKIEIKT